MAVSLPGVALLDGRRATLVRVALSIAVGAALLVADVLTGFKGLAGVLYVPLLVAVATDAPQRQIWAYGAFGGGLAVIAYLMAVGHSPHATTPGPIIIGLITAAITSALVRRLVSTREALQATNARLAISEFRHRSLFEQRRFAFWEEDYREVLTEFTRLRAQGVTSLADHVLGHPDFLQRMSKTIVHLSCNDAMVELMGGRTRADVLGPLSDVQPDAKTQLPLLQSLFDGAGLLDGPAGVVTLDGRRKSVWVAGRLYMQGRRAGVMSNLVIDLTAQEEAASAVTLAQAELARASRAAAVGALSASIARELEGPLAEAAAHARACAVHLRQSGPDLAAAEAAAERAASEGARAAAVVQRTREQVASRAGRTEPVDLAALASEALALLESEFRSAGVKAALSAPAEGLTLQADRVSLLQVLVNLLGNAVQALARHDGGERRVDLDLRREDGAAWVRVRDTGPGVAEADLERMFDPLLRGASGRARVGLAVSRSAVQAHGGELTLRSAEGGGALFECRLPLEPAAA